MPILIGSAAMAGAAITPPTTKAVEPSRSFFIILPLSLIETGTYQKACPTGGTRPANTAALIKHSRQTGVKKWTHQRTILPAPVASLSHFRLLFGLQTGFTGQFHGKRLF